jgi:DNA-binding NarL/FixJ family response regulator
MDFHTLHYLGPMKNINILLVDDEDLFRQGLKSLLQKETFIKEIYEARNSKDTLNQLSKYSIDLVLLDMKLPGIKGPQILVDISKHKGDMLVIAVTGLEGVELVINLLKLGVNGIVFKLDGYFEILKAIHGVLQKGAYFQEKILEIIKSNSNSWNKVPTVSLTFHENELLRAIASGLTTKAIASQLKMTEATTETYRIRLIRKLGAPNTAALLAYAYRNGIL